jgi:high-affinity nickel-transport protein
MRINGDMAQTLQAERPTDGSALSRFRRSLTASDWRSLAAMGSFIVLLHVLGFGVLFGLVTPQHFTLGGDHAVFTMGVGVLAYTFGLRHAFDADHIGRRQRDPQARADQAEQGTTASRCPSGSGSPGPLHDRSDCPSCSPSG